MFIKENSAKRPLTATDLSQTQRPKRPRLPLLPTTPISPANNLANRISLRQSQLRDRCVLYAFEFSKTPQGYSDTEWQTALEALEQVEEAIIPFASMFKLKVSPFRKKILDMLLNDEIEVSERIAELVFTAAVAKYEGGLFQADRSSYTDYALTCLREGIARQAKATDCEKGMTNGIHRQLLKVIATHIFPNNRSKIKANFYAAKMVADDFSGEFAHLDELHTILDVLMNDKDFFPTLEKFETDITLNDIDPLFTLWIPGALSHRKLQIGCLIALLDWTAQDRIGNCYAIAALRFLQQRAPLVLLNQWKSIFATNTISTQSCSLPFPHLRLRELMFTTESFSQYVDPQALPRHPLIVHAFQMNKVEVDDALFTGSRKMRLNDIMCATQRRAQYPGSVISTLAASLQNPFAMILIATFELSQSQRKCDVESPTFFADTLKASINVCYFMEPALQAAYDHFFDNTAFIYSQKVPPMLQKKETTVRVLFIQTQQGKHKRFIPLYTISGFITSFATSMESKGFSKFASWVRDTPRFREFVIEIQRQAFKKVGQGDLCPITIAENDQLVMPYRGGSATRVLDELRYPYISTYSREKLNIWQSLKKLLNISKQHHHKTVLISCHRHGFTIKLNQEHLAKAPTEIRWKQTLNNRVTKIANAPLSEEDVDDLLFASKRIHNTILPELPNQQFTRASLFHYIQANHPDLFDLERYRLTALRTNSSLFDLEDFLQSKFNFSEEDAQLINDEVSFRLAGNSLCYPFQIINILRNAIYETDFKSPSFTELAHQFLNFPAFSHFAPFFYFGDSNWEDPITHERHQLYIVPNLFPSPTQDKMKIARLTKDSQTIAWLSKERESHLHITL